MIQLNNVREIAQSNTSFRYESEMMPSLRKALPRMTFGHNAVGEIALFSEVPAVHGVPDLAAVRFDWAAVSKRQLANVQPLTTDTEVRAVIALGLDSLRPSELAVRMRMSTDYVRRAIVPLLVQRGWFIFDEVEVERRPDAVWIARRIVTVEAKLRDWRRAIAQARRQQLSADAAYVALDSRACRNIEKDLDRIAAGGVGVLSVNAESKTVRVLARPHSMPRQRSLVGRMLIAERCLDMWDRGETEGQIYPVFGWTVPEGLSQ